MKNFGKEWGRYRTLDGRVVSMQRGARNRVRFFDVATEEQVGDEQNNVAPAVCYAAAERWYDLDATPGMNLRLWLDVKP